MCVAPSEQSARATQADLSVLSQFRTTKTSIHDQLWMRNNPSYLINVRSSQPLEDHRLQLTLRFVQLLPPRAYTNPATSFCSRYAHTSTNKIRCPVNIVKVSTRTSS